MNWKTITFEDVKNEWILEHENEVKEFVKKFYEISGIFPTVEQVYTKFNVEEYSKYFGSYVILIYDNTFLFLK